MQQFTQTWKEIFFIHEYFYTSKFTFNFIESYYRDLRNRYGDIGQTASLFEIYSSITGNGLPQDIHLNVENYGNIDFLVIDRLDIEDLFSLEQFSNIRYLIANKNKIDSIVPLKKFIDFSNLDLSENKISNIEPLRKFNSIRHLNLSCNNVFDTGPLTDLENLWTLDIQANKIDYLHDLNNLKVLQELSIGSNNIKSLHGLTKLKELKFLSLGLNPLTNEELVTIKKSLPNCKISYEYYPPEDDGLGKYVRLEIFDDIVFMFDHSNFNNTSQYCIYYIEGDNNSKPSNLNFIMKRLIEHHENNNSQFTQRDIKRKHFWDDTDTIVSCQIEY